MASEQELKYSVFKARSQNHEKWQLSFVMSVYPSVRMEQLSFQSTDFHEIWY